MLPLIDERLNFGAVNKTETSRAMAALRSNLHEIGFNQVLACKVSLSSQIIELGDSLGVVNYPLAAFGPSLSGAPLVALTN